MIHSSRLYYTSYGVNMFSLDRGLGYKLFFSPESYYACIKSLSNPDVLMTDLHVCVCVCVCLCVCVLSDSWDNRTTAAALCNLPL